MTDATTNELFGYEETDKGKQMTFKVEQGNMEDGMAIIWRTDEFEDIEEALETFYNLKEGQWAIEEDVNYLFLISPDDEVISEHSFTEEN